jgi:hypothetical protein
MKRIDLRENLMQNGSRTVMVGVRHEEGENVPIFTAKKIKT